MTNVATDEDIRRLQQADGETDEDWEARIGTDERPYTCIDGHIHTGWGMSMKDGIACEWMDPFKAISVLYRALMDRTHLQTNGPQAIAAADRKAERVLRDYTGVWIHAHQREQGQR
jgi:hypothetical protein